MVPDDNGQPSDPSGAAADRTCGCLVLAACVLIILLVVFVHVAMDPRY
ncbi:hypothetical protein [Nonomuraea endophytica]|uniref:Uncharacterized protein n=1 Tax=Nonomuraea endophytica TaxID=714136 RepID=A0A7W8A9F2_9ACTN|nr:hypothetical protein [Nonomuraea endophytica]MBB5080673.1 hypothetical protein [Nonomuraea endophytica]